MSKGRDQEALHSLGNLRQLPTTDSRVEKEWYGIRAEVAFHKEVSALRHPRLQNRSNHSRIKLEIASWADCFKRGCWRRTHIGVGLMFFQQFVGINALIYYSPTLFKTMGLGYSMQLIMSGVLNITQLVGVSTSIWTLDRFGRRPLLLWGSFFMTVSHIIIAILVGLFSSNWAFHRAEGWVSVGFLLFYLLSFGASWALFRKWRSVRPTSACLMLAIRWAMPSEIFPSSLRAKGVALSTCSNWFNNFIIVQQKSLIFFLQEMLMVARASSPRRC